MVPVYSSLFREDQRFRQPWVWAMLLAIGGSSTLFILWTLITRFLTDGPAGQRPASDQFTMAISCAAVTTVWILIAVLYRVRLITRLSNERLYVHLTLFSVPLTVPIRDIQTVSVRKYRPIRDYGGWGTREGKYGRSYTISGNQAIELELSDGRRCLIGSRQPEILAAALEQARSE